MSAQGWHWEGTADGGDDLRDAYHGYEHQAHVPVHRDRGMSGGRCGRGEGGGCLGGGREETDGERRRWRAVYRPALYSAQAADIITQSVVNNRSGRCICSPSVSHFTTVCEECGEGVNSASNQRTWLARHCLLGCGEVTEMYACAAASALLGTDDSVKDRAAAVRFRSPLSTSVPFCYKYSFLKLQLSTLVVCVSVSLNLYSGPTNRLSPCSCTQGLHNPTVSNQPFPYLINFIAYHDEFKYCI